MVWYDLIKSLYDYLLLQSVARHVACGALEPGDVDLSADANNLSGAIFLIRDREYDEQIHHGGEGVVTFYVENWVRSDNPDPLDGYTALSVQENKFRETLTAWFYAQQKIDTNTVNADLINLEIDETIGDADSRRPILGSRTTIRVSWSRRTI